MECVRIVLFSSHWENVQALTRRKEKSSNSDNWMQVRSWTFKRTIIKKKFLQYMLCARSLIGKDLHICNYYVDIL